LSAVAFAAGIWRRVTALLKGVSGTPSYESYSWGPQISFLALFTYSLFTGLRLLSPLQWFKTIKRSESLRRALPLHSSLDRKARPDFHAADTERYFLGILLIAAACAAQVFLAGVGIHWHAPAPWWSRAEFVLLTILLVESVQWTFYYSLFRPLMERARLNTYDEAEYLVVLPLILSIQVLAEAALWHLDPVQILMLIFNVSPPSAIGAVHDAGPVPQPWQCLAAALLGQSYIVIIIASLIRVVPPLHVRKRPNITVIGCGDVVRNRILPALLAVYEPRQIAVAADSLSASDLDFLRKSRITNFFSVERREPNSAAGLEWARKSCSSSVIGKIATWVESRSRFAIIATPTPTHLDFAMEFARRGLRFGIEKPLVGTEAELRLITQPGSAALFENAFVLSYYWLEKALSLNYLLSLHPSYRRLLNVEPAMAPQEISYLLGRLGKMQQITIEFLEGAETKGRYWSELMRNGGTVMETLVHPFTILFHLVRSQSPHSNWAGLWPEAPTVHWFRNEHRAKEIRADYSEEIGPTMVEIAGTAVGGIQVNIRCGKYLVRPSEEVRRLIARYENGWITADLSTLETRLFLGSHDCPLTISNKSLLASQANRQGAALGMLKYQFQIDMLNTFFLDGWEGLRFDDYPDQVTVLQELIPLVNSASASSAIQPDTEVRELPWLDVNSMMNPWLLQQVRFAAHGEWLGGDKCKE
jgi:hypothetical protein